jgi:hypothetical protein
MQRAAAVTVPFPSRDLSVQRATLYISADFVPVGK